MMQVLSWVLALSSSLSVSLAASINLETRQSAACNNAVSLCSKSYDQVVHLGAHNSPFLRDATTSFSLSGNQYFSTTRQLDAGVRLLSGQVHKENGDWHLCHSSCNALDAGLLSTWLSEVKTWMDKNPNDVVTLVLVNSDNANRVELHKEFEQADIVQYTYTPPTNLAPKSWPTLQQLIDQKTRLMTFVASIPTADTAVTKYLMNEFDFIFENKFDNVKAEDFSCDPSRPIIASVQTALESNRMPFLNHFLYEKVGGILEIEMPNEANVTSTNSPSTTLASALGTAVDKCTAVYGNRPPTFILVDFFDQGPAIDTIDRLNGIVNPVGRKSLPAREMNTNQVENTFAGIRVLTNQVRTGETPSMADWIWGAGRWTLGGLNLNGGNLLGM